jgi:hypothetical protein
VTLLLMSRLYICPPVLPYAERLPSLTGIFVLTLRLLLAV